MGNGGTKKKIVIREELRKVIFCVESASKMAVFKWVVAPRREAEKLFGGLNPTNVK
jgi:hypothetical protein